MSNLRLEFEKAVFMIDISTLEFSNMKSHTEIEILKYGTKNSLIGFFSGWNLKKTIFMFQDNTLELTKLPNLVQKKNP